MHAQGWVRRLAAAAAVAAVIASSASGLAPVARASAGPACMADTNANLAYYYISPTITQTFTATAPTVSAWEVRLYWKDFKGTSLKSRLVYFPDHENLQGAGPAGITLADATATVQGGARSRKWVRYAPAAPVELPPDALRPGASLGIALDLDFSDTMGWSRCEAPYDGGRAYGAMGAGEAAGTIGWPMRAALTDTKGQPGAVDLQFKVIP